MKNLDIVTIWNLVANISAWATLAIWGLFGLFFLRSYHHRLKSLEEEKRNQEQQVATTLEQLRSVGFLMEEEKGKQERRFNGLLVELNRLIGFLMEGEYSWLGSVRPRELGTTDLLARRNEIASIILTVCARVEGELGVQMSVTRPFFNITSWRWVNTHLADAIRRHKDSRYGSAVLTARQIAEINRLVERNKDSSDREWVRADPDSQ